MAYQHAYPEHGKNLLHSAWNVVKTIADAVVSFLISIAAANTRVHKAEYLQSKSDEELAAMGLRRDEIARYVFRDMLDV